ncbi:MAG: nuclear transport factor 2 family protein [Acidobacteriota bacterium]
MPLDDTQLQAVRDAYAQWERSAGTDSTPWLDLMADDVKFLSLGGGEPPLEFSEDRTGKEGVKSYFAELTKDWELLEWKVNELVYRGETLVALSDVRWQSRHNGSVVATPKADVMHFRDGKVIRFQEFFDTAAAHAAAR